MEIERLISPPLATNVYIAKQGELCFVVDPSGPIEDLLHLIGSLTLQGIFLTHGHIDHISALEEIHQNFPQVPIWTHQNEQKYFQDARWNLSHLFGGERVWDLPFHYLSDGEMVPLLGGNWSVIHSPGHTAGSLCFYEKREEILFSGDVLFASSIGRTDFPGGNSRELSESLARLMELPETTVVFPGHGEMTNIGVEKRENPFIK